MLTLTYSRDRLSASARVRSSRASRRSPGPRGHAGLHREHRRAPEPPVLRRAHLGRVRLPADPVRRPHAVRISSRAFATSPPAWPRSATTSPLHRTLAFGIGAFVAAIGGMLYAWWFGSSRRDDGPDADHPATGHRRDRRAATDRGRLDRRARVPRHPNEITQSTSRCRLRPPGHRRTFNTVIGFIFLAIVIVSPGRPDGALGPPLPARRRGGPPREVEGGEAARRATARMKGGTADRQQSRVDHAATMAAHRARHGREDGRREAQVSGSLPLSAASWSSAATIGASRRLAKSTQSKRR